jgi:hypothetical protein
MAIRIKQSVTETHRLEDYPKFSEEAMRKAANAFVDEILPKHFTEEGADEYQYEERSAAYTARKLRRFGHQRPLELSGEARRQAVRATIRVLSNVGRKIGSAQILVEVPFYISNIKARRREIQATSKRDGTVLAVEVNRVLTDRLNKSEAPREVRA